MSTETIIEWLDNHMIDWLKVARLQQDKMLTGATQGAIPLYPHKWVCPPTGLSGERILSGTACLHNLKKEKE